MITTSKCPYSAMERYRVMGKRECVYFIKKKNTEFCDLPNCKGICKVEQYRRDQIAIAQEKVRDQTAPKISNIHPLIKGAIRDALIKALKAKPVKVNAEGAQWQFYEMDGEVWNEEASIDHIMRDYSWWRE